VQKALDQSAVCACFNRLFANDHQVVLRGGGAEPDYTPPDSGRLGVITAREDFASSALHEAAHWCVAGDARRRLADYGYVYTPPPRGPSGQARFFASELRTQATELFLARRAGVRFFASADDPDFCLAQLAEFSHQVHRLADSWEVAGEHQPPPRAVHLAQALAEFATGAG